MIKSQTVCGIGRAIHTIAIQLARAQAGNKNVPVMVAAVSSGIDRDYPRGLRIVGTVEEEQLDGSGLTREHTEVDSIA